MTLKELREKRNAIKGQIDAIIAEADASQESILTAEQTEQISGLEAQWDAVDATVKARERAESRTATANAPTGRRTQPADGAVSSIEVGDDLATTKPWASLGEQLLAVQAACHPVRPYTDPRLQAAMGIPSGANESIDSEGGFLVATDFSTQLLSRAYATGQVSSRTFKLPLSSNANSISIPAIDETSRADGSRYGGIRVYWADEAATVTATKPKFRRVRLELEKLMGLCYATEELLQDASAIEAYISRAFGEEFGFKLDDACINGTGAGQNLGILNSDAYVSVAKETGQAAKTIVANNIIKMWSRMWAPSRLNAVWYINQDIEPQLATLSLPVGTGGVSVYLPANGLSTSPYSTLYGRPVIPIEQCATLGTVGDIILADMSQYLMIDKGGLKAESSMHVRFLYDEMAYRWTYRCNGAPWWNSVLTPKSGSTNTLAPFVVTAVRA